MSLGDPDGEDFAFTKCDANGNFVLHGHSDGNWRITVFDQWNDQMVDGLSTPVALNGRRTDKAATWGHRQEAVATNIYTTTFFEATATASSMTASRASRLVHTNIRFRDGSYSNFNNTDLNGNAGFNEMFPLFNWYVVETDTTRYKNTGTHVVYDAGGPADGTPRAAGRYPTMRNSIIGQYMANTPSRSCRRTCGSRARSIARRGLHAPDQGPTAAGQPLHRPHRSALGAERGLAGLLGQNEFLEFGKKPFIARRERRHPRPGRSMPPRVPSTIRRCSSTQLGAGRPGRHDQPVQEAPRPMARQSLEAGGHHQDHQLGRLGAGLPGRRHAQHELPRASPPRDLFYLHALEHQPHDVYNPSTTALPNRNSQFKCYDGMHNWNQLQPAPYDGMYSFPSTSA